MPSTHCCPRAFLLALSSILLLAACQPKYEIPAMTPEESQVIENLTTRLKPRCIGRYRIDPEALRLRNYFSRIVYYFFKLYVLFIRHDKLLCLEMF